MNLRKKPAPPLPIGRIYPFFWEIKTNPATLAPPGTAPSGPGHTCPGGQCQGGVRARFAWQIEVRFVGRIENEAVNLRKVLWKI